MAVTATAAAPASTIPTAVAGSRGVNGTDAYANADGIAENKRSRLTQLTLSGTYATGGFALVPANFGLSVISAILLVCDDGTHSGAAAVPVLATSGASPVVKLVTDNTAAELANATAVTNFRYTVILIGT